MTVYLTARNPTDAVTLGLLPAAARLGRDVVLLTDQPVAHEAAYAGRSAAPVAVVGAEVGEVRRALVACCSTFAVLRPDRGAALQQ